MLPQHTHPSKISGVAGVRRRNHAGKRNRAGFPGSEPPMAAIEFRNPGAIEERKPMEFRQGLHHLLVLPVNLTNPVRAHLRHRFACSISLSEMPLARAQDSTAATPYWATAFLTAQQGTARGGGKTRNPASTIMTAIIFRARP